MTYNYQAAVCPRKRKVPAQAAAIRAMAGMRMQMSR